MSHLKLFTGITDNYSDKKLETSHSVPSQSSLHTSYRHGCKLKLVWLAEAYNHKALIVVFTLISVMILVLNDNSDVGVILSTCVYLFRYVYIAWIAISY